MTVGIGARRVADIGELDEDAQRLRVTWRKTHNFVASFAKILMETKFKFEASDYGDDKYGSPWTFDSWLGFKAGLIESQVYRMLNVFEKALAENDREIIAAEQQRMADEKRAEKTQRQQQRAAEMAQKRADKAAEKLARDTEKAARAQEKFEEQEAKKRRGRRVTTQPKEGTSRSERRMATVRGCGFYAEELLTAVERGQLSLSSAHDIAQMPEDVRAAKLAEYTADTMRRSPKRLPAVTRTRGDPLAVEIIAGHKEAERGIESWVNGTMRVAIALAMARAKYPSDNDLNDWLKLHKLAGTVINKNDRAAFIKMGQNPEIARRVLERTTRSSIRRIGHELDAELGENEEERFPHVGKPTSEENLTVH